MRRLLAALALVALTLAACADCPTESDGRHVGGRGGAIDPPGDSTSVQGL